MAKKRRTVIAKRVKVPLGNDTILFIPLIAVSIIVIALTPVIDMILRDTLYSFIAFNTTAIYIACIMFIIIGIIASISESVTDKKLPEDCIVFEDEIFKIYDRKNYNLKKENILSVEYRIKNFYIKDVDNELKIGKIIIKAKIENRVQKLIINNIYNVPGVIENINKRIKSQQNDFDEIAVNSHKNTKDIIITETNKKEDSDNI